MRKLNWLTISNNKRNDMNNNLTIVSDLPGRVRFRMPFLKGHAQLAGWLHKQIWSFVGVQNVRLRPSCGSVAIEYDPEQTQVPKLQLELGQLDITAATEQPYEAEYSGGDNLFNLAGWGLTRLLPESARMLPALGVSAPTILDGFSDLFEERRLTVEVLDALALSLSIYRRDYNTAMLTQTLLTLGEYMEQQTSRSSDKLLAQLMQPKAGKVWVQRGSKQEQIALNELVKDDLMLLGPGDVIPADGSIVKGVAQINQSTMTGESLPVKRGKDSWVYSGTTVQEGQITVQAKQVGDESSVAHIRRFIIDSLSQRSETQEVTQEMANRRVWITLGVGALVFLMTRDLNRLASVFLVDYSCALKLSTPIAFKSMMYRAANTGLLLKGGRAIEQLADVDTIVFDKTGTLTHGDMDVTEVVSFDANKAWAKHLLAVAASVEEHSNHPLASAIVHAAEINHLPHIPHGEIEYVIAHGMVCETENKHQMVIGSRHFLENHHFIRFDKVEDEIVRYEEKGCHLLFISIDKQLVGMIALKDRVRDEAAQVIARLKALGIGHTVLLTGDHERKAKPLAEVLGLDEVYANASPEEKVDVVKQLQQRGHKVWYVGDGVNDAPVLTQADVGMAMQQSTDLAQQAADAVLLQDSLYGVLAARELALKAMGLVKSNIKATEWINTGIMMAAAFGYLQPGMSALLHNGTTLGVLLRSLAARKSTS